MCSSQCSTLVCLPHLPLAVVYGGQTGPDTTKLHNWSRKVLTIEKVVQLYSTNLLLFISHLLRVHHSGPLAIYHLPETLTRR